VTLSPFVLVEMCASCTGAHASNNTSTYLVLWSEDLLTHYLFMRCAAQMNHVWLKLVGRSNAPSLDGAVLRVQQFLDLAKYLHRWNAVKHSPAYYECKCYKRAWINRKCLSAASRAFPFFQLDTEPHTSPLYIRCAAGSSAGSSCLTLLPCIEGLMCVCH
jgi:hypothetical protein